MMTKTNQQAARDLAVAYLAFHEAHAQGDEKRRGYWAGLLRRAQERTGVELHAPAMLLELEALR